MKKAIFTALCTLICMMPRASQATDLSNDNYGHPGFSPLQVGVSFQVFYDQLTPYGHWYRHPRYGYAWAPDVAYGFSPYATGGHWVFTNYGWTWVSDYNWGWAPFHYGRWVYDDEGGWLWVPGYEWSPAWVTWGGYGGYYGWAPLPWGVRDDDYYRGYRPEYRYWTFCDREHFNDVHMERYGIRNNAAANTYYTHITVINNYTNGEGGKRYAGGPRRDEVERVQHTTLHPATIKNSTRPGRDEAAGAQISMYRPAVAANTTAKAAPTRIEPIQNLKTNHARVNSSAPKGQAAVPVNRPNTPPARETQQQGRPTSPQNNAANMHSTTPAARPNSPSTPASTHQNTPNSYQKPEIKQAPATYPQNAPATQQKPAQQPQQRPVQQPVQQHPQQYNNPQQKSVQQPQPRPAQQPMHQQAPPRQEPVRPAGEEKPAERPRM